MLLFLTNKELKELLMTIEDQVTSLQVSLQSVKDAVAALDQHVGTLSAPPAVDLSGVLSAIADVRAQLSVTPAPVVTPAPAPVGTTTTPAA